MSEEAGGAGRSVSVVVVTVSDRVSAGVRPDQSGPLAEALALEFLTARGWAPAGRRLVVPDERERIRQALVEAMADGADLVLTVGGTGIGPRDVTPEATREVLERELPGFAERARALGAGQKPPVLLSRALAGVAGRTLVFNLPGAPAAVREYLGVILPAVPHALAVVRGEAHRE